MHALLTACLSGLLKYLYHMERPENCMNILANCQEKLFINGTYCTDIYHKNRFLNSEQTLGQDPFLSPSALIQTGMLSSLLQNLHEEAFNLF